MFSTHRIANFCLDIIALFILRGRPLPRRAFRTRYFRHDSSEFFKYGFGENLEWDVTKPDRPSVALEYYTRDAEAEVRSPCDLYLEKIMDNEAGVGDFELELRTSASSAYYIYIDHVRDLRFAEGDFIAQGQVIGLSGVSPAYRSELQVNFLELTVDHRFHTIHYCPLNFGTEDFIKSHTDFAPLGEWRLLNSIDGGYYG